jgi:hypothetical protein
MADPERGGVTARAVGTEIFLEAFGKAALDREIVDRDDEREPFGVFLG